jgi:hypothetical protein
MYSKYLSAVLIPAIHTSAHQTSTSRATISPTLDCILSIRYMHNIPQVPWHPKPSISRIFRPLSHILTSHMHSPPTTLLPTSSEFLKAARRTLSLIPSPKEIHAHPTNFSVISQRAGLVELIVDRGKQASELKVSSVSVSVTRRTYASEKRR